MILTAADANYRLQVKVLIQSLIATQGLETHILVVGQGWTPKLLSDLRSMSSEKVSIEHLEPEVDDIGPIRLASKFPAATIYGILAPTRWLAEHDRVLYLDADTVVMEDLQALWAWNLHSVVAAVRDAHIASIGSPSMWRPWLELGVDPLAPYLNTGVMLIDLLAWRDSGITERAMTLLRNHQLPCVDQDALNLVIRGAFDQLPPRYNSMPFHHLTKFRYVDMWESAEAIGHAVTDPAIIHFHRSFLGKPWNFGCSHPESRTWRELADQVEPNWHRKLDFSHLARKWAARRAGMLDLDSRSRIISASPSN